MNKLILENVSKTVNDFNEIKITILKNVNFILEEKNIYTLVGHSGSGKSTLAKIISTFDKDFNGTIKYLNDDNLILFSKNKKNLKILRSNIKIVFQNPNLQFFKNSILDEIIFTLKLIKKNKKLSKKEICDLAIEEFNKLGFDQVNYDLNPNKLSLGQKRFFLINLILLSKPKILILDEPTVSLDQEFKDKFIKKIKSIVKKYKIIVLIITHDLDILKISKQSIILFEGEQVFFGNTNELEEKKLKIKYRLE